MSQSFRKYVLIVHNLVFLWCGQEVNKTMHILNGNRGSRYLDILHQNIPGTFSLVRLQIEIENILRRYRPDVLVLSEVDYDLVKDVSLDGYQSAPGTLLNGNKTRVSALFKSCLQVTVEQWNIDICRNTWTFR